MSLVGRLFKTVILLLPENCYTVGLNICYLQLVEYYRLTNLITSYAIPKMQKSVEERRAVFVLQTTLLTGVYPANCQANHPSKACVMQEYPQIWALDCVTLCDSHAGRRRLAHLLKMD